jgi:hypothetical protein
MYNLFLAIDTLVSEFIVENETTFYQSIHEEEKYYARKGS